MKKIFYALAGIVLAVCMTGCGKEGNRVNHVREVREIEVERRGTEEKQEESEAEAPVEETDTEAEAEKDTETEKEEKYSTLEEYYSIPAVKATLDNMAEAQSEDGISVTLEVKDNEFIVILKIEDSSMLVDGLREALLVGLDAQADTFAEQAERFDNILGQEDACTVVMRYTDPDGDVIVEKSFNANGEETEEKEETEEISSAYGYSEGRLGDTMKTYFFNYTVNSAYLCEEYNGYRPAEGNCLLVAEVTVKNTFHKSIEMYDTDFQVQWNSDGPDDYDFPVTLYDDPVSDEQLEATYELGIDEEVTGLLVFEVPAGEKDFSISYQEFFDDDSEGDVYFVFFTAKMQ